MAIFLHKLPYRKNAIHFLTMAIFPYGNFPIHSREDQLVFSVCLKNCSSCYAGQLSFARCASENPQDLQGNSPETPVIEST